MDTTANYGLKKPAYEDGADIEVLNDNAESIDAILFAKSSKSTLTTITLPASGWTGDDAPYRQTVGVEGVTETSVNELLPGENITADELGALQAANIQDGGQATGSITMLAYGDKPSINLPVRIIVRGDM